MLDEDYKKERIALENKYIDLRAPFVEKREQIVNATIEVEDVDYPSREGDNEEDKEGEDDGPDTGIPGFWLQAMTHHQFLRQFIHQCDLEVLEELSDITIEHNNDMTGFTLTFKFKENDYFTNKELKKKYVVTPDLLDFKGNMELEEASGTDIDWKAGKNLLVKELKKKQKAKSGKRAGQTRVITTQGKTDYFLCMFCSVLFYSVLFYSILFYSILFYFIVLYCIWLS